MAQKKTIVANWKMNGSKELCQKIVQMVSEIIVTDTKSNNTQLNNIDKEVILCPPFVYLDEILKNLYIYAKQSFNNADQTLNPIKLGAQNCSKYDNGARTGEISAKMLQEIGCSHIIVGHSERRTICNEKNEEIAEKIYRIIEQKMIPIVCIGESLEIFESDKTLEFLKTQIDDVMDVLRQISTQEYFIAYEPIWAIGTGKVATFDVIKKVHQWIKEQVGQNIPLLYGGSVNAENCAQILQIKGVDGVLVGGASLKLQEFQGMLHSRPIA
jgi:triosephosphate isomerase (TIM)